MKKNNIHIINILKGVFVGIANVIPGFSGGTMAVLLNVYDTFIYAFANIFNNFKNAFKRCWSLFLGIIIGILLAVVTVVKLLEVIPFITIMFFVGLIIGSIPQIYKKAKVGKLKIIDIISFLIAIAVIVVLPLITTTNYEVVNFNVWLYIILLLLGVICSSAMVVPGVSGSLVLMAFGYYTFIMTSGKNLLKNLFNFSFENYWNIVLAIGFFTIGCLLGLVLISKLIAKLMEKHPKTVYMTILGLLLASPFGIIYAVLKPDSGYSVKADAITIIFSIVSFIAGVAVIVLMEYFSKKKQLKNNDNSSDKLE